MSEKELKKLNTIAIFVAISCVLQIAESLIPHPIPGLRLGLSNVMTLIALARYGTLTAMEIAVLRTVVSSFIMGTFMSPTFILSFSGAVVSTGVMAGLFWLSSLSRHARLSIVGLSVVGALAHNMVQLYLAYILLIKHKGIFVFFPWLCIGAVVMGWVTGVVAGNVCRALDRGDILERKEMPVQDTAEHTSPVAGAYVSGSSFLHHLAPEIKIGVVAAMSVAILALKFNWLYIALLSSMFTVMLFSPVPLRSLFSTVKKYSLLILMGFFLPLLFNHGTHHIFSAAFIDITSEGLSAGGIYASRIIFLILANALLMSTTPQEELTKGLAKVLLPLKIAGISPRRIAMILSLSLAAVPTFWETARKEIRGMNIKKASTLYNVIPLLSGLIITLYAEAEQRSTI